MHCNSHLDCILHLHPEQNSVLRCLEISYLHLAFQDLINVFQYIQNFFEINDEFKHTSIHRNAIQKRHPRC